MGFHNLLGTGAFLLLVVSHVLAAVVDPKVLDACPGYNATDVQTKADGLIATLVLRDKPCNVFGDDTEKLMLAVVRESGELPFSVQLQPNFTIPKKPTEFMSRYFHLLLDMKFQSRFYLCQNQTIQLPLPTLPLTSITQLHHSLSRSFAHPPKKSSFRPPIIQLFSNPSIFASNPTSQRMLTSMASENIPTLSASRRIIQPLLSGLAMHLAYLLGRICMEPTQSILSIVRQGLMAFSFAIRMEWTSNSPKMAARLWNTVSSAE